MDKVQYYFKDLNKSLINNYYELLSNMVTSHRYTDEEINLILKAYKTARELHKGTYRHSGELYIVHPLNVANILVKYGFNCNTICAALLHDTVEDTKYTLEDIKRDFNDDISMLVDGVTKMQKADFASKEESKIATHKKILQSITKDARIIAIKLADRLHNMLTLEAMDKVKQLEISEETAKFYVPIARNLGMYKIKDEIQDLSLFYLDTYNYEKHYELRKKIKNDNREDYNDIGQSTKDILNNYGIPLEYNYKVKNVAGIYDELLKGRKLNQIHDLVAIRMLLNEPIECYEALGVVHSIAEPIQGSVADFIAAPKPNGYRSINTNVLSVKKAEFQVRIRTKDMQQINSLGIVSNWNKQNQEAINEMCISLVELNNSDLTDKAYVQASENEFLKKNIIVDTINGKLELKEGSTGYDFLSAINKKDENDNELIINNEEKSMDSILNDGDFVVVVKKENKKNNFIKKLRRDKKNEKK